MTSDILFRTQGSYRTALRPMKIRLLAGAVGGGVEKSFGLSSLHGRLVLTDPAGVSIVARRNVRWEDLDLTSYLQQ